MVTEFLYVGVLMAFLIYLKSISKANYWKKRGVKCVRPYPLFGNALNFIFFRKSSPEMFQDFYNAEEFRDEGFGGIFLGARPCLFLKDPDLIKKVMVKDFEYFSDRGIRYNKNIAVNANLFNLRGWKWWALRLKLSPTFTSGKLKMMFNIMSECAEELEKILAGPAREGAILEMKEPLARFTTDTIGTCAFGLQLNALQNRDCLFRKMGKKVFSSSVRTALKRVFLMLFPRLAYFFGVSFVEKEVSDFFENVVKDVIKSREEGDNKARNDFIQLLIELKNNGSREAEGNTFGVTPEEEPESGKQVLELTDDLIAAQAFIFFFAGFENSSSTMSFALYEMAFNPDVQEKLALEIRREIRENDGVLTYDLLLGMKYLDMVVAETLRKYPPQGNLFRRVVKPYQIEGTKITLEPDLRVFIPVHAIHRDPKYFPDPERFDPERFTPEEKMKRPRMSYLPFGDGPRSCIGSRFGLLQAKLGLCTLLNRFVFEACPETPYPPRLEAKRLSTVMKGGVTLRIKERAPTTG